MQRKKRGEKSKVAIFKVPFESTHELPKIEEVGQVHRSPPILFKESKIFWVIYLDFLNKIKHTDIHLKMTSHLWKYV